MPVVVIGLGLLFCLWRPNEPQYQGRSLNEWLNELDANPGSKGLAWQHITVFTRKEQLEAVAAIKQMGPLAVPCLLRRFESQDSFAKEYLLEFSQRHPGLGLPVQSRANIERWQAAIALANLGEEGKAAIPELKKYLANRGTSKEAAYALSGLGSEGTTALLDGLKHDDEWSKYCVLWSIGGTPVHDPRATEALVSTFKNGDEGLRAFSLWALGEINSDPVRDTPLLLAGLADTNALVRSTAARALKTVNPKAAAAAGVK